MSEPLARIIVPWDVAVTGDNRTRRLHWAQRSTLFRNARSLARWCWQKAGSPTVAEKVRVSLIVRRGRSLDHFNAAGGCKPILDGIFVDALTPDDSAKWVEVGTVTQETNRRWRGLEEVEVIVEAVDA